MKTSKLSYVVWGAFPLTKAVYAYLAFSSGAEAAPLSSIQYVLFAFGVAGCAMSALLSRRLATDGRVLESPLARLYLKSASPGPGSRGAGAVFSLYVIALGLSETCALYGLVGFMMTGSAAYLAVMTALCLASWAVAFPGFGVAGMAEAADRARG